MSREDLLRRDWYSILGASPSDSPQELKQKYQKLALLYHPDKQSPDAHAAEGWEQHHVQKFIEVDQAWKILSNEETKRAYDLQRRASELQQSYPIDTHISLDDMHWDEEEQVYTHCCRCGGNYILGKEDIEGETVVCCDTCSLSIEPIYRAHWPLPDKEHGHHACVEP